MRGYNLLFTVSTIFTILHLSPLHLSSHSFTSASPSSVSFPFILSRPSPFSLYFCQAVKWMLAYFRALLSNSLSCAGQVRGSAECKLAADETSTQKQLARPPTVAWRSVASVLFTSQIQSVIYIQRSEPSPSEDFRSVNVGRLLCGHKKNPQKTEVV